MDDDLVTVPFDGLIGRQGGNLFDTPVKLYDFNPTDDTDSLPGEDGSEEKMEAIQARIKQRVEELKRSGQWGDDYNEFGRNPLADVPVWRLMYMQARAVKPYDSPDELALTYLLTALATVALSVYLLGLGAVLEPAMKAYIETDFDSDFASKLFRAASGN